MTVEHSLILPSVNRSRWRVREREREREADLDVKRIEQLESSYPLHPEWSTWTQRYSFSSRLMSNYLFTTERERERLTFHHHLAFSYSRNSWFVPSLHRYLYHHSRSTTQTSLSFLTISTLPKQRENSRESRLLPLNNYSSKRFHCHTISSLLPRLY